VKTELDHLPLPKREQLAAITALLRENAPVDMIILFGSYAPANLTNKARLIGGRTLENFIVHEIHDINRQIQR